MDAEQTVTPWEVKGKVNYLKLIENFGTNPITNDLVERWERVTKMKIHPFLQRGLVFSHQDLDLILDDVEAGRPVYLYTGRGPSTESMHLGHMVPFLLTKYLQDALNCIVVIQMSDDEKFFFKEGSSPKDLEGYRSLAYKNAKDIIACGFDVKKTFIFSNMEYMGGELYFNNVLIMKATTMNQVKSIYGLGEVQDPDVVSFVKSQLSVIENADLLEKCNKFVNANEKRSGSDSVGQCVWPCFQCGPAFCTSFKTIFLRAIDDALSKSIPENVATELKKVKGDLIKRKGSIRCLVPMAIDQAPYFRMARDDAHKLDCFKPAVIHSEFLPGLNQAQGKMSSTSDSGATIFLDMDVSQISKRIAKYAFSGGRETLEEQRQYGANIKIDICFQYLIYFMESTQELKEIAEKYSSGQMLSGEIKKITGDLITKIITEHQLRKKSITDEELNEYFNPDRIFDIGGCYNRVYECEGHDFPYGIDFDRTFGK